LSTCGSCRSTEPDAFFDDQLGAMISATTTINSIGLSNISRAPGTRTAATAVACVQNLLHVTNCESQPVLGGAQRGIAFVPFRSLGFGVTGRTRPPAT
jgi:hypothetical protein